MSVRKCLVAVAVFAFAGARAANAEYIIRNLGAFNVAYGINNAGDVVGGGQAEVFSGRMARHSS